MFTEKDEKLVNVIKALALDSIECAGSGHPGIVLSAAEMLYVLYTRHMHISSVDSKFFGRDRFVLSAGHGSALLYSMLHAMGFLQLEELKSFRQLGSTTPGHPEITTPGVDASTGPLGQGIANAVGMAIAETRFDSIYDSSKINIASHYTYCICGDGCLMEGVGLESLSIAGHLALNKLILLYDHNSVTLDGPLTESNHTDYDKLFDAFGWNVIHLKDGHNMEDIDEAIILAKKSETKPTVIICDTVIGRESIVSNSHKSHGAPFGTNEVTRLKQIWKLPTEPFTYTEDMKAYMAEIQAKGRLNSVDNLTQFALLEVSRPDTFCDYTRGYEPILNLKLDELALPDKISTRKASGIYLNHIAKVIRHIVSLTADVSKSTLTDICGDSIYSLSNRVSSNFHFGVSEHAMGAIANGMALHGGLKVVVSCFLAFSDYLKPAIRMAAIQHLPIMYLFTHDSIHVGEDGPTHQPVEQIDGLRAIPSLIVVRPCDKVETAMAYDVAFATMDRPVAIILTRQDVPTICDKYDRAFDGAYFLSRARRTADAHLIGSGSEVQLLLQTQKLLRKRKIETAVISVPSIELLNMRPKGFRERVIQPNEKNRLAVECSSGQAMRGLVGSFGDVLCMEGFGLSGKAEDVVKHFGFTPDNIALRTVELIERNKNN